MSSEAATLAGTLARAIDPVVFALDSGITPDEWQAELLRSTARRVLLLCSRQSGKSTVTAILALWVAIVEAPSLIVIVSPSQRQSAEALRSIMLFHARLAGAPPLIGESVLKAEFANGSRILAMPGVERTIRGLSGVAVIIVDEAARIDDELIAGVRPMLATSAGGGRLIALTTPHGRRGWFYQAWHDTADGNNWSRVRVSAEDCPRISQEFLTEELRELGPLRFSEEYSLAFVDNDEQVFPGAIIAAAFTSEVTPLWT
jgi:Terminase large subunit, T4likevirus-type, N-terminal